ncbi:MAG: hypothetical protein F6K26_16270 [Moorea sp. SIO2I5]|nr:hypothetical protein [Moorena sp. SIO2I5]
MTSKVYAPNVHLFAFHLKTSQPTTLLWDKCNQIFSEKFGVTKQLEIEEKSGYRVDLLKDKTTDDVAFHFGSNVILDNTSLAVTGVATPVRIQDTYALALNLRRPELEQNQTQPTQPVPSSFLEKLNPAGCLMPEQIGSSLGQTLVLTVWYTQQKRWVPWKLLQNRQELRQLADECLRAFIPAQIPCPHFNQAGELFGSPIFEYGVYNQSEKYCHILVWIFWEPEASDKFIDYYSKFINLFCYRNKVIRAYQLNRQVYKVIKTEYQNIEEYFDNTFQNWPASQSLSQGELNKFKEEIKSVSQKALDYSRLLRDLEHYRLTITINAENYKRELTDISSKLPQDDLSFLETFFNDCRLFQEQIKSDLGYFGNGAGLLEQALSAIRARVEIEQAEREKRLQRSIALVGTGLAVSAISSQTAGKPVESIITQLDPKQSLDCPTAGFTPCLTYSFWFVLFHVGVGAIAALILNGIINLVSKDVTKGNRE